jgi:hypothetical protein
MKTWLFWTASFFTATGLFLVVVAAINRFTIDRLFSVQERLITLGIAMVFAAATCAMAWRKLKAREPLQR